MTDKVQKIREEVERLKRWNDNVRESTRHMTLQEEDFNRGKHSSYLEILNFIDSLQEEPVYTDFTKALAECIHQAQGSVFDPMVHAELCENELVKLAISKEPVSEDLEDYINEISKQFPEVSFAKLSRIAVRVAKWQKEYLWKPADGDDLPEYDREVIAILDYDFGHYKVVYAHRPNPNGWNGTNIDTEEKEHFEPVIYGKGGWNQPHVLYWLDAKLPYEENKIIK